jgi:hypothetical protein
LTETGVEEFRGSEPGIEAKTGREEESQLLS